MINWNNVTDFALNGNPDPERTVEKTEEEWRALLTPDQFQITRLKGTERAFSSDQCALFSPGTYACICCDTLLFDSSQKFDSGTGWPSFTQPIVDHAVAYNADNAHGMQRIEAVCNTCDAHLGHVFPDGPEPSGLRYCINSLSMHKIASSEE